MEFLENILIKDPDEPRLFQNLAFDADLVASNIRGATFVPCHAVRNGEHKRWKKKNH